MTINSPIPMLTFKDGPRTIGGVLDAAIDQRGYELDFLVTGTGTWSLVAKAPMDFSHGYKLSFSSGKVTLTRVAGAVVLGSAAVPVAGSYCWVLNGSQHTIKNMSTGAVLIAISDPDTLSGLRLKYAVSGVQVTTAGKLL